MPQQTASSPWLYSSLVLLSAGLLHGAAVAEGPLTAGKPIVLPGGAGGFDWMRVDDGSRRLFATHKGTKSLAVLDLKSERPLPAPTGGTAQGVDVDRKDNKIFLGGGGGRGGGGRGGT